MISRLRRLCNRCDGRVFEQNTLYDTPQADLRRRHWLLRVRIETPAPSSFFPGGGKGALLTLKTPAPAFISSRYKERIERELTVGNPRAFSASLRHAGFRPGFRYEKFRSRFRPPGLHLDLDETPIGVFLELEGAPRAIDRAARALGFTPRDYIRATYWDLYAADCRRLGLAPRNMVFKTRKDRK